MKELFAKLFDRNRAVRERVRVAQSADPEALRSAWAILEGARLRIIREDNEQFGAHQSGDIRWSRLWRAGEYLSQQLDDAVRYALGEEIR